MIDLHSHVLPGIDDGSRTIEDARELARAAVAEGVRVLAATPHVRFDYPTTPAQVEAGVAALRADFAAQGIELELVSGGELDLEWCDGLGDDDLRRLSYGGAGAYVLLEFPYSGWPLALEARVSAFRAQGIGVVVAHPERNRSVRERPEAIAGIAATGALIQVTAGSLEGRFGRGTQAATRKLLELGLVHVLASDAHTADVRAYGLAEAAALLRDEGLARFLTEEAPAAILAGEHVPAPPRATSRKRWGFGVRSLRR